MLVAALLLLPGLGEFGLATRGEVPVLDRTLAALGVPRAELERNPWLPDALRTWCFAAFGEHDWSLRIPGALAVIGLVGLTGAWARRLGWTGDLRRAGSITHALLPPLFALALPLLLASGRTVLGEPIGELWVSAAPLALLEAFDRRRERSPIGRAGFALLGLALLLAGVASLGIVLGACLPLAIVALADSGSGERERSDAAFVLPRPIVAGVWAAAIASGMLGLWLGWKQGEGYIPLLGAAKDLARLDDPSSADFTASLQAFGYQTFPLIGLVLAGLLAPGRTRLAAMWLAAALALISVWSLVYGPTPAPVCVPVALLASAAVERMLDPREPIAARRLILLLGLLGALVLGKDAGRTPELIASPLIHVPAIEFPAKRLAAAARLDALADWLCLALVFAHVIALPSRDQLEVRALRGERAWLRIWSPIEATLDRLLTGRREASGLGRLRRALPAQLVLLVLLVQAWVYGHSLLADVGEQLSIAGPLRRWSAAVDRGDIRDTRIGLHRIRDPGLEFYGPGETREVYLSNRAELDKWLFADRPRAALIRRADLAAAFSSARGHDEPFHVIDDRHWDYVVVGNFIPENGEDQNPLLDIVVAEPPTLANQTLVGWDYMTLVAWEIEGELHRGAEATMHMVFEVKRAPPAGIKMYARLQQGKLSRVAAEPHELTGGDYPPNYWRAGDIIHHRFEFKIPTVEVMWGEHELIVGMRRSEKTNLAITVPEGSEGEYGVRITGSKHEFAVIGTVDIAW
ncbi:hypothetical protein ACNOYE_20680 [Nannocystaceae bacterium ST9]